MYNLHVGNQLGENNEVIPLDNPSGMQDEKARGWFMGNNLENPVIGVVPFASDTQKGVNYNDYNGSIVEGYVNNYKNILENNFGVDVVEAGLLTKDELIDAETFACTEHYYCPQNDNYSWIYSTSYWLETAGATNEVWYITSNKRFDDYKYNNSTEFGVRPVIVISKDYF